MSPEDRVDYRWENVRKIETEEFGNVQKLYQQACYRAGKVNFSVLSALQTVNEANAHGLLGLIKVR